MATKTKKQAPTGAQTTRAKKNEAPNDKYTGKPAPEKGYAGKPEPGKEYGGKNAYDDKTVDEIKSALYRIAEGHYNAINKEPLNEAQKTSLKGGIDGVVDLLLLARRIDPKGMNGLGAVVTADAGQRYGINSPEARHYLSEIARKFAGDAELKPYEKPADAQGGYGGSPGKAYGGLGRDLGQLLESYLGKGPQPAGGPAPYGNKGA